MDHVFESVAGPGSFVRPSKGSSAVFFFTFYADQKIANLGSLATPKLRAALRDTREPVRVFAAESLAGRGEAAPAVIEVLSLALDQPPYRGGAVQALKKLGPPAGKSLPALRRLAAGEGAGSKYKTRLEEAIRVIGKAGAGGGP